ncbi:MAG: FG-GAP repeat protein [Bacteroidia bacterium]|nr:FG-GAP repeat protein [Bacteroidia bacterium]MCO5253745.1 T9SS type A sorting domain-containing protein [Bacteroidota bacterium]
MKKIILYSVITLLTLGTNAQPGTLLSAKKIGEDNNFQFFDTLNNHFTFGRSLCNLGDLDGDGVTDIAVGVVDQNISSGVVYILFLNSDGGVKSHTRITRNEGGLNTASPNGFNEFGQSIASLGDLDGDGVVDIAVGNNGFNLSYGGEIYILFLNADGTVKNHSRIASNVGGFAHTITGGQNFSKSIANIGDIDGDGVIDIAVGNHRDGDGGTQKGAVYVLFLNSNGTVKKFQKISQTSGGFTDTIYFDGWFGSSVCSFEKGRFFVSSTKAQSPSGAGAIWLLTIDSNGMVQNSKKYTDTTLGFSDTLSSNSSFGSSLANIGDLDGDSISEIAIGALGYNDVNNASGAFFIFFLDINDNIKIVKRYSNSAGNLPFTFDENALFGTSIISIGDFNKDKKLDVLVSSSRENIPSQVNKGRLNLLFLDGIEHELSAGRFSAGSRSITVYPNPANSKIKVSINGGTPYEAEIQITDISGKICMSLQGFSHNNEVDVSPLKAGVYFIRLQTAEGAFQAKLIINH